MRARVTLSILIAVLTPLSAAAQAGRAGPHRSLQRSVPAGTAVAAPLSLSLEDAIARGLATNLAVLEGAESLRTSRAQWLTALSSLLPNVTGKVSRTTEQVDLASLGFTSATIPGLRLPDVLGPFHYIDARAYLTQRVFSWSDISSLRAASAARDASQFSYRAARELVVQATATAYLLAGSDVALVDATRAQVATARAALQQVTDRHGAGLAASIDVLRARVQLQNEEQRLIAAETQLAVDNLTLARVIGLPNGQAFTLADDVPYTDLPEFTVEEALARAHGSRPDYQSARARLRAAELTRQAAVAENYPSAALDVNYGVIGTTFGSSHGTVTVAGSVSIPLFPGTTVRARVLAADAALKQAGDDLADLGGQIDYEVRSAVLNFRSAKRLVAAAASSTDLAGQALVQARNRFGAGIVDTLEVVQAQESLAIATQSYIASRFTYNTAKVALAQAVGAAERSALTFLGVK